MERFRAGNPDLSAGQLNIQESKAHEVTAYLRPNPNASFLLDQLQVFNRNPYRPVTNALPVVAFDYLHERQHKRELRLESAQQGTAIAESQQQDLERTLLFNLRTAFVQTLQAKALLANAKENLDYFDKELAINRDRYRSGDIARVDLDRIALQRVQYESDYQTARGECANRQDHPADAAQRPHPGGQFRRHRPLHVPGADSAAGGVPHHGAGDAPGFAGGRAGSGKSRARITNWRWRTDRPIPISAWTSAHTGADSYIGVGVSIPLRIFDRNQGEKARTQIDITHAERQKDSAQALVFSDVDSAYFTLLSTVSLLRPYGGADGYLETASRIRDTMSFSYQRGQAALVDYLDAQRDFRATQVAYINLVGAYLAAAGQLNMAVGREAIP